MFLAVYFTVAGLGELVLVGVLLGMQVRVTPGAVEVRLGALGRRALRLDATDVVDLRVRSFEPFPDFGGPYEFGMRWKGRRLFYFGGSRGVELETRDGARYLIGSHQAELLAAATEAVRETATESAR